MGEVSFIMEQVTGIEPAYSAWKSDALPTDLLRQFNSKKKVGSEGFEPTKA